MELRHYFEILKRRRWIVLLACLVATGVVAAAAYAMPPVYSASTLVRVAPIQDRSIDFHDLNYSNRLMKTYAQVLRSRPILEELIQRLDLDVSSRDLARKIKVEVIPDTELLRITAEADNASQAMDVANTLASLLTEQGQRLYSGAGKSAREILAEQLALVEKDLAADRMLLQKISGADAQERDSAQIEELTNRIRVREQTYAMLLDEYEKARVAEALRANTISIVEPAVLPEGPSRWGLMIMIALGELVGLTWGIGLAFVRDSLDSTIHTADEVEEVSGLPVLASIPKAKGSRNPRHRQSIALQVREAYRMLHTSMHSLNGDACLKTMLITSAGPETDRSTVVVNLAKAMAQAGSNVLIVEGDFRQPKLHRVLDLPNGPGLSEILSTQGDGNVELQPTDIPGVRLLTSGSTSSNGAELFCSSRTAALVKLLGEKADVILINAPPVTSVADASILAQFVDRTLLVVSQGRTKRETIQEAMKQLRGVQARVLGVIFQSS